MRGRIAFASIMGSEAAVLLLKAAQQLAALDAPLARETYLDAPQVEILTSERAGTVGTELATSILQPALAAASRQIGQHLAVLAPAGPAKVLLASPVTVTTAQYRPLPAGTALGLSAFYLALLTIMCGFLGATIVNSVVDSALGYATNEIGPRWRQRRSARSWPGPGRSCTSVPKATSALPGEPWPPRSACSSGSSSAPSS